MPTARELLEQADALMRRNRSRSEADIPVLTDVVTQPVLGGTAPEAQVPVLTETIEEIVVDIQPLPEEADQGEPSLWLGPDTTDPAEHSVTGPAPDTVAMVPPVTAKAAGSEATPPPARAREIDPLVAFTRFAEGPVAAFPAAESIASEATPPIVPTADDEERWRALAEQVSMQVLQRIDLFTDTGLKEQLALHLQPIVERASAELVGAINDHVGQLLRAYVAEAIEREIAQWRRDQH